MISWRVYLMDKQFTRGYGDAVRRGVSIGAGQEAEKYVRSVEGAIDQLAKAINAHKGTSQQVGQLKGFIFEEWHAGMFNVDAVAKRTGESAQAIGSNKLASPDIVASWNEIFGLKNYHDTVSSAKEQALSFYEVYRRAPYDHMADSFEAWCGTKGIVAEQVMNNPIYEGQRRLIPADQLEGAKVWLRRRINSEQGRRPEQVARYEETLRSLSDRIISPKGASSKPLTEPDSRAIAKAGREGTFGPGDHNVTLEKFIGLRETLGVAFDAGAAAALIAATLVAAPALVRAIADIIKGEYISREEIASKGLEALSASSQGFIHGATTAAIITTLRKQVSDTVLQQIGPEAIGVVTVLAFNTMTNAVKVAKGSMDKHEFHDSCMRDLTVAAFAFGSSIAFQALLPIPVLGLLLGNIIGGAIGAFVYNATNRVLLSFCADTGYTLLGIVEQDYSLPDHILRDMGLDTVVLDYCMPDLCSPDTVEPGLCEPDVCESDQVQPYFLRRGIIGINRIGFLVE